MSRTILPSSVAGWAERPGVADDAVADRLGEVEPAPVALERVDDAQRVLVVAKAGAEALAQAAVQGVLADVAERRVAEVVAEPDGLAQVLVERQRAGHGPRDLGHLERVGQPRAVVVAGGRHEHLGLVLEAAKRLAVDDPVAVALKRRAQAAVGLGVAALRPGRSAWPAGRGRPPPARGCARRTGRRPARSGARSPGSSSARSHTDSDSARGRRRARRIGFGARNRSGGQQRAQAHMRMMLGGVPDRPLHLAQGQLRAVGRLGQRRPERADQEAVGVLGEREGRRPRRRCRPRRRRRRRSR